MNALSSHLASSAPCIAGAHDTVAPGPRSERQAWLVLGYLVLALLLGAVRAAWAAPLDETTGPAPAKPDASPRRPAGEPAEGPADPGTPGLERRCLGGMPANAGPVSDTAMEFAIASVPCTPQPHRDASDEPRSEQP